MKVVLLSALFPELKGKDCYQRGKGTGGSVKAATARAFAEMYKHMKSRKKLTRFTQFSVQVTVGDVPEEIANDQNGNGAAEQN